MTIPSHITQNKKIVLFDGVCKLCNGWSRFLLTHDKQEIFKLCTVQSKEGQEILAYFSLPTDTFETMLYIENGVAYSKSNAFLKIIGQLSWPYKGLKIIYLMPKIIRDWLYDRIALNRYALFGKYDTCLMPLEIYLSRFINKE